MFFKQEKQILEKKIETLTAALHECKLYSRITSEISEILATTSSLNEVTGVIKKYLNLHTCYINYDIDARTNKAHVAGLETNFGKWFGDLTKRINGIPFSFVFESQKGKNAPLNAADYISRLTEPVTIKPESFRPLILTDNIEELGIDTHTIREFLITEVGDLRIIPFRSNSGALICIKNKNEFFSGHEEDFLLTLSHTITLTLDRIYHTHHDELGFKNIVFFKKQLMQQNLENKDYSILSIKIEGLKQINDDYSHAIGNLFLKEIVKRIKSILKKYNFSNPEYQVARKNGSILLINLPLINNKEELMDIILTISVGLKIPYRLRNKQNLRLNYDISIGGCISIDCNDIDLLLDHSTEALHEARKNRKQNVVLYSREIEEQKIRRKYILKILKSITCPGEDVFSRNMHLVYQQKMDVINMKTIGFEALIRLNTEEYGMVTPDEFIKIAEEENLIEVIDLWVVKEVCRQIIKWAGLGYAIPVSVNISRYHINNEKLADEVRQIFEELDFSSYSHLITFEITETGLLDQNSIKALCRLNSELGLKVSVDDVGKSHANLHAILILYLNNLVDTVKIDKEYIKKIVKWDHEGNPLVNRTSNNIVLDEKGCKYIQSIMNIFKGLFSTPGIPEPRIVCEGVEYKEQVDWLKQNNCQYIQGYFYGEPVTAENCKILL